MVRVQAFQQAGLAAQRATQTTEAAFNAYYNLAAFYARENDFAHTEQSLRAAISHAPNWFKTHWMLAQVLEAASRLQRGAKRRPPQPWLWMAANTPKLPVRWSTFAPRASARGYGTAAQVKSCAEAWVE